MELRLPKTSYISSRLRLQQSESIEDVNVKCFVNENQPYLDPPKSDPLLHVITSESSGPGAKVATKTVPKNKVLLKNNQLYLSSVYKVKK